MGPVDHEESGDEEIPFYRGTDCLRAQAGLAGDGYRRGVPQDGHCGGDVLRVAQEVQRAGQRPPLQAPDRLGADH